MRRIPNTAARKSPRGSGTSRKIQELTFAPRREDYLVVNCRPGSPSREVSSCWPSPDPPSCVAGPHKPEFESEFKCLQKKAKQVCRRYVVEYESAGATCPAIDESNDCLSFCSTTCFPPGGLCSSGAACSNGFCESGENCATCPSDCCPGIPAITKWGLIVLALLTLSAGTLIPQSRAKRVT